MKAFRLAFSFIRIPRLFATLLLIPLIFGLLIFYGQLLITGAAIKSGNRSAGNVQKRLKTLKKNNLARKLIYGDNEILGPIQVCRWISVTGDDGQSYEVPPSKGCSPDRLDVAIIVDNPAEFDVAGYIEVFDSSVQRLHVCTSCTPDIRIEVGEEKISTRTYSIQGLMVLSLANFNDAITGSYIEAAKQVDRTINLFGLRFLHASGFREPIMISGIVIATALICSVASIILIALWLAVKAHRKVLDYFTRNGALLPMVAATGKKSFYGSIWVLTLMRVGAFLLASIPISVITFNEFVDDEKLNVLFRDDYFQFGFWIIALIASLGLATIIASIADLKHRHNFFSFMYRYLALIICGIGALIWCVSFIIDGTTAAILRNVISALPVVGVAPVLVAPIFKPITLVLIVHTVLASVLLVALLRYNARWFAAHLEDL